MISKLFGAIMLRLTRLIVRLDTVREAVHQGNLLWREINEE